MIHGDVFRAPDYLNLFAAVLGAGAQIFSTVLILLVCVLLGVFKATKRGALLTALIVIYALCGLTGGLVAGRIFKQLKGKNWVWNVVLTASVFPVPLGLVFAWVNTVAWNFRSTAALPVTTIGVQILLPVLYCHSHIHIFTFFQQRIVSLYRILSILHLLTKLIPFPLVHLTH